MLVWGILNFKVAWFQTSYLILLRLICVDELSLNYKFHHYLYLNLLGSYILNPLFLGFGIFLYFMNFMFSWCNVEWKKKKKQMDTPMLYDTYREIEREI